MRSSLVEAARSSAPAADRAKVMQVAKDIASGKIANIPETVG